MLGLYFVAEGSCDEICQICNKPWHLNNCDMCYDGLITFWGNSGAFPMPATHENLMTIVWGELYWIKAIFDVVKENKYNVK